MAINFEEDASPLPVTDEQLKGISAIALKLQTALEWVGKVEQKLKEGKKRLETLQRVDLPEAMRTVNLKTFELEDGTSVEIKDKVFCTITTENEEAAFKWLIDNGFGDLIKNRVTLNFGRQEMEKVEALLKLLDENGYGDYEVRSSVHANTLSAFVRERISTGMREKTPLELFSAYEFKEATLKASGKKGKKTSLSK